MKKFPFIAFIVLALIGCEKTFFGEPVSTTYTATFEHIWQYTDAHYCCFDFVDTDWDSIHTVYAAQITDDMSEAAFIEAIDDMLSVFEDYNVSLVGDFGEVRYDASDQYPANIDTNTIKLYNPTSNSHIIYDSIAYLNNFISDLADDLYAIRNNNTKGIIIDFRNLQEADITTYNDDSKLWDIHRWIEAVSEQIGTKRTKTGPDEDDFNEFDIFADSDLEDAWHSVAIINYATGGDANEAAYRMSHLPNATIIGTSTRGGNLDVVTTILPNGWLLRIPETVIIDLQGNSIGRGIEPDIIVEDDTTTTEIDEVIERALEILK